MANVSENAAFALGEAAKGSLPYGRIGESEIESESYKGRFDESQVGEGCEEAVANRIKASTTRVFIREVVEELPELIGAFALLGGKAIQEEASKGRRLAALAWH
mgnify:CR=1 FL=1